MGQTLPEPRSAADPGDLRLKSDKIVLITFAAIASIVLVVALGTYAFVSEASAFTVMGGFFGGLAVAFVFAGIPAYRHHARSSLTPQKTIRFRIVLVSAAAAVLLTAATAVAYVYWPEDVMLPEIEAGEIVLIGVILLLVFFLMFICICYAALVLAFGAVGVMTAVERRLTPWILDVITQSGDKKKLTMVERALRWLFDVPYVLDTKTLSMKEHVQKTELVWKEMGLPVALQLFFGLVLGIYVSLNPFISDRSPEALVAIFSMLSNAALVIPVIVLPWFIFRRLGVSIKGQTREFTLYNGIKARVFQSYFAVGTIVIIVRLSISEISVTDYIAGFASFMIMLFLTSVLCTFVYFNYFENALAEDISREYGRRARKRVPERPPETP
jgi:hypothetical protein